MSAVNSTWHRALFLCGLWCVHSLTWAATGVIIDSPVDKSRISSLAQLISIRFTEPVQPTSVSIRLNGRQQNEKFTITSSGAKAFLSVEDGIRPSLGRDNQLYAPNIITVYARSTSGHPAQGTSTFFVMAPVDGNNSASTYVPTTGGTATLPNYASIDFPANAFVNGQSVTVSATSLAETGTDWTTTSAIFGAATRAVYEVRIHTGMQAPSMPTSVRLNLPADYVATFPDDGEAKVFVQIFEDGGEETLDSFEIVDAVLSEGVLTAILPNTAFTNRRRIDANYEAVIIIGMLRTKPTVTSSLRTMNSVTSEQNMPDPYDAMTDMVFRAVATPFMAATAAGECKGGKLGSPIDNRRVTSPFNPEGKHYGVDYDAADGTSVKSMADGTVERIGYDARPLTTPDPRSGKLVKGWGRYVIVRHSDGSTSLYAHLQTDGVIVQEGGPVSRGDVLGGSDNSGGSSGPHLHVEYAPNGKIYEKSGKADAEACIDLVSGSVSIRDNGSLADDAFSLYIAGAKVCSTTIGASNTCAIGALRSGTTTITLVADSAPDNIATYALTLGSGLKFSDGSTSRTGTIPQGGSVSYTIIVP